MEHGIRQKASNFVLKSDEDCIVVLIFGDFFHDTALVFSGHA
jgi:hypothetical protein